MRFGKTFAAYELAKQMDFKRVLVLTFKPAVQSAWKEDLLTHVDFEGWQFISNKEAEFDNKKLDDLYNKADKDKPSNIVGWQQEELGKDIDSSRVFFGTIHSFIRNTL